MLLRADERGERLTAIPKCERNLGGTFEVTEPPPPPAVDAPFAPHAVFAIRVGLAMSALLSNGVQASGFGPSIELEAGYRMRRRIGVALFAGYTSFHDSNLFEPGVGLVDVGEQSYFAGAVVRVHYANVWFGGGIGFDDERYATNYTTLEPMVQIHAGYTFACARGARAQVMLVVTNAFASNDDVVCGRISVGVEL